MEGGNEGEKVKTNVLFLHHHPIDQMPQQLMRILLRRLRVLIILQTKLPQQRLGVERLLAHRGAVGRTRLELVEEDEERGGHGEGDGEGIEVWVVVRGGGGEGLEGGRGGRRRGDDVG